MMALIEQAIDTSILAFKTKSLEQISAEDETEETILSAEPTLVAANA
jgi:hypothetical protein